MAVIPSPLIWGTYDSLKYTKNIDWLTLLAHPFYLKVGDNIRQKV